MVRRLGWITGILAAISTPLMLGGCPQADSLLNQLGEELGVDVSQIQSLLSDTDAFKVLGEVVEADLEGSPAGVAGEDLPVDSNDEQPHFGEDESLFTGDVEQIEVSEAEAIDEAAIGDGAVASGSVVGQFWNDIPESDSSASGGLFRGTWFAADGSIIGVLRGEYRPLPREQLPDGIGGGGVFHGKYIGEDGRFRGRLIGRYGETADGRSVFVGRWLDRKDRRLGLLKGHWSDDAAANGGTFAGRWAAYNLCNEVDSFSGNDVASEISNDEVLALNPLPVPSDPLQGAELEQSATADPIAQSSDTPCVRFDRQHGFLAGLWSPLADDAGRAIDDGEIRGEWRDANNVRTGTFIGRYESRVRDEPDGDNNDGDDDASGEDDDSDSDGDDDAVDGQTTSEPSRGGRGAGFITRGRIEGSFIGRVVNDAGETTGYFRGIHGKSVNNVGIFRGKYFDAQGRRLGFLGGRWSTAPDGVTGNMVGMWELRDPEFVPGPDDVLP